MTKRMRIAAAALLVATGLLAPANPAAAGEQSDSKCSSWTGARGLKVRTCMSMAPSGNRQNVTGRIQVKNPTKRGKNVSATVTVRRAGSRASTDTGSIFIPRRTVRTVVIETRRFRANHGTVTTVGSMTHPVRRGSWTLQMDY